MSARDDIWKTRFDVTIVTDTGSTNADLLAQAAAGAPDGSVLVADHQTAGRGRRDRTWDSQAGANLLVSILFRRRLEPLHALTQRVAVATALACADVAGVTPSLKWPNDLLLEGRKLAGILAQAGGTDNRVEYVVVGLGLNIGWAPPDAARLPTGTRDEVLGSMLSHLAVLPDDIYDTYRAMLSTIGMDVRVVLPEDDVFGVAVDVERDGRLAVRTSGGLRLISAGDVVHMRPAAT